MDEKSSDPADAEQAAREAYASGVEDYFLRRRGVAALSSPRDWALVSGWFDEGIPLAIALAGLAEVFDRHAATGQVDPVSSLSYCRHAVRKRFVEYQRASAGGEVPEKPKRKKKGEPAPEPGSSAGERFAEAIRRLEETAPAVALALASRLEAVRSLEADESTPLSDREGEMIEIERAFAREILPKLPDDDRSAIDAAAEAPFDRLRVMPPPEEIERLREIGRLRALRHRFALPRFTIIPRS